MTTNDPVREAAQSILDNWDNEDPDKVQSVHLLMDDLKAALKPNPETYSREDMIGFADYFFSCDVVYGASTEDYLYDYIKSKQEIK